MESAIAEPWRPRYEVKAEWRCVWRVRASRVVVVGVLVWEEGAGERRRRRM